MKKSTESSIVNEWKTYFSLPDFLKSISFLFFSLYINYYAVRYATAHAGPAVPDVFLSNFKIVNTLYIDAYLSLYIAITIFLLAVIRARFTIFFINTFALLILTRCFFINLTYLGIPSNEPQVHSLITYGGDLFFSGHTAYPFLAALVFWNSKVLRYVFIILTIFMGWEVIAGHHHYSIDVFAAPFITYGVFSISKVIFKKYYLKTLSK